MKRLSLNILGTRGIPACHGGFETFAEKLAIYLTEKGWKIRVYCQVPGTGSITREGWCGIDLVRVPVARDGALGTMLFDLRSTLHACRSRNPVLVLGYNTAVLSMFYRLKGIPNIINMDGLEWQREKWGLGAKAWLYVNERCGAFLGNHLVADHPEIKRHLMTRVSGDKISMIPYGADQCSDCGSERLNACVEGLESNGYALIVARPEPENSIYEMVAAFSRCRRHHKMVVLGDYDDRTLYQRKVLSAASNEVIFPGAIHDQRAVTVLRCHCSLYLHGHRVGGTNPSLVEALGAGSPILAMDNRFNRWVAGDGASYFATLEDCADQLDRLLADRDTLQGMKRASRTRHMQAFQWPCVLEAYEELLTRFTQV